MSEKHRYICNSPDKITANSSNELLASNALQKKYMLALNAAETVILHPSFLCPGLKKTGDELHLYMLVDGRFYNTYKSSEGKQDKKAGPALSAAVNRFLKIVNWKSIDKTCHVPKPLFASNDEAKQNIEVHYLWCTNELKNDLMLDKDGKPFAQIHPKVCLQYQHKGLYWGVQIVIKNLPNDSPGLYDISWVNYKQAESEDEPGYFYDLQDQCVTEFNKTYRNEYHPLSCDVSSDIKPVFTEVETEIMSYHPLYISDKECLDIGHLSDVHVSSRQHLFTQSKAKLIEGDDGADEIGGMVNTSYANLKNLMMQMGDEVDLLIFTGDLIDYNHNYNPNNSIDLPDKNEDAKALMSKSKGIWQALNLDNLADKTRYPIGIDNLVMYELFRWYYREKKKPILLVSGNHEAYTLPYGISPRIKFWRSIGATILQNNSDLDVIIQKSIEQAKADKTAVSKAEETGKEPDIYYDRANEGVPADHNLTITEAALMYGPDYARVVMSGSTNWGGERNFRAENMDWFYHLFTPLSSFYQSYADQCLIGLGWGEDEKIAGHIPESGIFSKPGGILPRAIDGISDAQLTILEQALKAKKGQNILCSHFTYANYNTPRPIEETGQVSFSSNFTQHDYGTFKKNRAEVYPLIQQHKIQYTLSGHSHRAALYQFDGQVHPPSPRAKSSLWKVQGQAPEAGKYQPQSGARMLVAASGGPIPVQNHKNELYNWGLDTPSGNYIKFKGSAEDEVGVKTVNTEAIPQAKPRLAVALDFADIFLRDKKKSAVFEVFESRKRKAPFTVKVSEHVGLDLGKIIGDVRLVIYQKDGQSTILNGSVQVDKAMNQGFEIDMGKKSDKQLFLAAKKYVFGFIDITLKQHGPETQIYDTDKHWVYPIELISFQTEALEIFDTSMSEATGLGANISSKTIEIGKQSIMNTEQGYLIQRHRLYGEIPDFRFYKDLNPEEYSDETQQ